MADALALPFQEWPQEALIRSAMIWRMIDVDQLPLPAHAVVATQFPSYFIRHPNKIVWLFRNYRPLYDLQDVTTDRYSRQRPDNLQLAQWIQAKDTEFLSECKKILTISSNVRNRLRNYLDLDAEVLFPPSPLQEKLYCSDYEPFVFAPLPHHSHDRADVLIQSMEVLEGDYKVVFDREEKGLRDLIKSKGLEDRVFLAGRLTEEKLLEYFARCKLVFYAPYDEDYCFPVLEAFGSRKPVITATDSGGPLEFVEHRVNGCIVQPDPVSIATALQEMMEERDWTVQLGESGFETIRDLTWLQTISRIRKVLEEVLA
jgi:glycosyltransferase involved in cell wall biosynthesis